MGHPRPQSLRGALLQPGRQGDRVRWTEQEGDEGVELTSLPGAKEEDKQGEKERGGLEGEKDPAEGAQEADPEGVGAQIVANIRLRRVMRLWTWPRILGAQSAKVGFCRSHTFWSQICKSGRQLPLGTVG